LSPLRQSARHLIERGDFNGLSKDGGATNLGREEQARSQGRLSLDEANARADKAIAALGALADEIAKVAEQRPRPWCG
jgi:hypothetical protein